MLYKPHICFENNLPANGIFCKRIAVSTFTSLLLYLFAIVSCESICNTLYLSLLSNALQTLPAVRQKIYINHFINLISNGIPQTIVNCLRITDHFEIVLKQIVKNASNFEFHTNRKKINII